MLINKIAQSMQGEMRKVDGTRARVETEKKERPKTKEGVVADRSEFSVDGKKQNETKGEVQIITSMINAQPDVRAEKVTEAQTKITAGFYNSSAFAEKLAERVALAF